ncbi:hypothetical protein glysoja_046233 [Glycine soja]|uniref:Uncharacterized protein n=1 Tax=Glycine soja TaxID=3848 RepID=A0A0B2SMF2_GLYSO|nr:hypothetical protein glysoja_046233 [Glycine soja]
MAYVDDVIGVSVDKVIDGKAEVPFPTSEIKYVRQALNIFIAWPTPLVKLVSNEDSAISPKKVAEAVDGVKDVVVDDPLRELIKCLVDIYDNPIQFVWDGSKFGIPNVDSTLFFTYADVNEITTGDKWLNIAILQLWTMYMDEWSNSLGHGSLYGSLEPQSIHNAKDRRGQCEEYIGKWLKESQRQVAFKALKTTDEGKVPQRITDEGVAKVVDGLALKVVDEGVAKVVDGLYKLFVDCDYTILIAIVLVEWEIKFQITAECSLTEPYVVYVMSEALSSESALFLAANKGASGIDGLLSTTIGFAIGCNKKVTF